MQATERIGHSHLIRRAGIPPVAASGTFNYLTGNTVRA